MDLLLRVFAVMGVTACLVFGTGRAVRRLLGDPVKGWLVWMVLRLLVAVSLAVVVGLRAERHAAVLVSAVGAAYFATIVAHAWRAAGGRDRPRRPRSPDS